MVSFSSKTKTIILLITVSLIVSNGLADSNWTVEKENELNQDVISPISPTIQVLNISAEVYDTRLDNPTRLTPELISQDTNMSFTYNKTEGDTADLEYMGNGFWYASFEPLLDNGGEILYSANGTTPDDDISNSTQEANLTETLTIGDYQVELQNNYNQQVKAGRQFEMEVQVTNTTDESIVDDTEANVQAYFQNTSEQTSTTNIDNYENGVFYNSRVFYPNNPDSNYIMHVEVYDSEGNLNGSTSRIIDIAPSIEGQINQFSASEGCATTSMVENCEQGANIDIEYQITNAQAENVNLSIYGFNESGRHRINTMNLTQNGDTFTEQIQIPDLNTSKYDREMEFKFNATNNYREHIDRHNVTLELFKIQDRSPPTTYIGQNYQMQIFFGKPYTLNNYQPDRFQNIQINITDSNDQQIALFSKDDLTYSSTDGTIQGTLLINEENPTGSYGLQVTANNTYGENRTINSGFSVRGPDSTFDAQEPGEWETNRITPQIFSIDIENLLETQHELTSEVTQLEDQITVLNETIELEAEATEQVFVEVELEELTDKTGEIKFIDESTNYNQTIEVDLQTPDCQIQVGNLCSQTSSVDVTASTPGTITESITLRHIGAEDSSETINNTVIEGEIGPHLTIQDQNTSTEISGEQDIQLDFQPQAQGYFEGQVVFENTENQELTVPVSLDYNGDPNNPGRTNTAPEFSLSTNSINLGTVVDGETSTQTITITNTVDSPIETITASSNAYTVSLDTDNIEAEESTEATLTFEDVSSSSGTIQITGQNTAGENTETISVTASPIQNYADRTTDLDNRIRDLQGTVSEEYQTDLTDASTRISEIQTQWDRGNYEQARSTYRQVDDTLTQIELATQSTNNDNNQNQESSGSLLLPIIAIIVILLVIGFVFYESYIPEEGDPLYSVLGENQR